MMSSRATTAVFSEQTTSATFYTFPDKRERLLIDEPNHSWWPRVKDRLEYLNSMEEGWDGYQAIPVSFLNASYALDVLKVISNEDTPEPQIVPGGSGDQNRGWLAHERGPQPTCGTDASLRNQIQTGSIQAVRQVCG